MCLPTLGVPALARSTAGTSQGSQTPSTTGTPVRVTARVSVAVRGGRGCGESEADDAGRVRVTMRVRAEARE